ncbi:MAG: hypothetical protein AB1597_09100 [Chloroflexota bacterium]
MPDIEGLYMELWDAFVNSVDKNLKYLEDEYGFKKVSVQLPFVIYESSFLRIRVYYECGGRFELDLDIEPFERIDKLGRSFDLAGIIHLHNLVEYRKYEVRYPRTKEEIETGVQELARLLKEYGAAVLHGDFYDLRELAELSYEAEEILKKNPRLALEKTLDRFADELFLKYAKKHRKHT